MQNNYNDQIDNSPFADWRKAVREAIMRNEVETRKAEEHLAELKSELERLRNEEELIAQAKRARDARLEAPKKRFPLMGNSLREILIIHFADSDGIIIGKQASETLVDIKYFPNRGAADGAIYTILSKSPFVKIDKGIYLVPSDSADWRSLRQGNGHRPKVIETEDMSVRSIRQAQAEAIVIEAKKSNGYMRSNQAVKTLERTNLITNPNTVGWDAHHVLTESGKFIKVSRGLYQLKNQI